MWNTEVAEHTGLATFFILDNIRKKVLPLLM